VRRLVSALGAGSLALAAGALVAAGAVPVVGSAGRPPRWAGGVVLVGAALGAAVTLDDIGASPAPGAVPALDADDGATVAAVGGGAVLTRLLVAGTPAGVVTAAAAVGLLAAAAVPRNAAAAYCGAFVGMADPEVFRGWATLTAAAAVAGGVLVAAGGSFDGVGGELGTVAFVACLSTRGAWAVGGGIPAPTVAER